MIWSLDCMTAESCGTIAFLGSCANPWVSKTRLAINNFKTGFIKRPLVYSYSVTIMALHQYLMHVGGRRFTMTGDLRKSK